MDQSFYTGEMFDAYQYFGAKPVYEDGIARGVDFRVYAPSAERIDLIGDFNDWTPGMHIMEWQGTGGVLACHVPEARVGMRYKYKVFSKDGWNCDHTDPYALQMQLRPESAAIIIDPDNYTFTDREWMRTRSKCFDMPLNIYEMHMGSWRTNPNDENGWFNYVQIAERLIPYLKENHFTHVEIMPVMEHPSDISWGYQLSGFFAPTSRYGTPAQLKEFVDRCHNADIGVIFDFVPVHFALDDYGLAKFDGTALYEYPAEDTGYSEWGSHNFNFFRGEVRSFLQSSANYWLTEFHADGLRMDAISNVLYWQGDADRGVNEGGVQFVQNMNDGLQKIHPTSILMAEDSSNFLKVTAPTKYGGLGFDYKWDMGWMNDTLDFFRRPAHERRVHYHMLSFSMMYFYNENYLLPFSHDEVVHGKATILQKMNGDYEDKFPQGRVLYTYMFTHPGKKLNFMGNELGQLREWDEGQECDWMLLDYPLHDSFYRYFQELSKLYTESPALHDSEYAERSFRWLEIDRGDVCTYVYERINDTQRFIVIMNLDDRPLESFVFGYDRAASAELILHSDWQRFGGGTKESKTVISAKKMALRDFTHQFEVSMPAFSSMILEVKASPSQQRRQPSVRAADAR